MKEAIQSALDSLDYFSMHFGAKTSRYYKIGLKVHHFLLKVKEIIFGKESQSYLNSVANLATYYRKQEENELALKYAVENVEILQKLDQKDDPLLASGLHLLGLVYYKLEDYKQSLKTLKVALEKKKSIYGELSIPYAKTLRYIGKAHRELREFKEAMKAFKKVLEIREKLHDGKGEKVITAVMHIAETMEMMGKWSKAIDWYLRAGEIFKVMSTDPSFDKYRYVNLLIKVAKVNEEHAEYDECAIYYQEALKFMKLKKMENQKMWEEVTEGLENLKVFGNTLISTTTTTTKKMSPRSPLE
jgi:tetratricopeptide (TPR) repeat protein